MRPALGMNELCAGCVLLFIFQSGWFLLINSCKLIFLHLNSTITNSKCISNREKYLRKQTNQKDHLIQLENG